MKKIHINQHANELTYGRGYVYFLQYHIAWCTKDRNPVLCDGIDKKCIELLEDLAVQYQFTILEQEVMPDYIHLFLDCKPQFHVSDMIKILKGGIARQLFLEYPTLKETLRGQHLWNPSYFVVTVTDRSKDQIAEYLQFQMKK